MIYNLAYTNILNVLCIPNITRLSKLRRTTDCGLKNTESFTKTVRDNCALQPEAAIIICIFFDFKSLLHFVLYLLFEIVQ